MKPALNASGGSIWACFMWHKWDNCLIHGHSWLAFARNIFALQKLKPHNYKVKYVATTFIVVHICSSTDTDESSLKKKWWPNKGLPWHAPFCQVTTLSHRTLRWSSFSKLRWSSDKGSIFLIRVTIDGNLRIATSFEPKTARCANVIWEMRYLNFSQNMIWFGEFLFW